MDDEIFWLGAVLLGDPEAIEQVRDGWVSPDPIGAALGEQYRVVTEAHRRQLADLDLDLPPRWWPAAETFGGERFETGWQVVHRALAETSAHAGHLDIARELIDGHQHLVLG